MILSPMRPRALLFVGCALSLAACGGAQPATSAAPEAAPVPAPSSPSAGAGATDDAGAPLTAARCQALGGEVVGDIGDGAIHRPGYRCARSGKPPLGHIAAEPGKPMAIEGAVCCP